MQPNRTLLDKWRLVRAALRDNKRLSTGDVAVLVALCDRYGSKTRPGAPPVAGHALLAAMSGLSRRATIDSTRRLIETGYIQVVELGKGTKGTTYSLNFARGEDYFTSKGDTTSGEAQLTTVVKSNSPLAPSSGEAHFTESPLTEAPLQGGLRERGSECPAASPPDAGGFSAAAPGAGQDDEFETLWTAYGVRRGYKDAQIEFGKLPSDVHAEILAAASAWREGWAGTGKPHSARMGLAKWLRENQWRNDPPTAYTAKERKPRTTPVAAAPEPANDNSGLHRAPGRIRLGRYDALIVDSQVEQVDGKSIACLHIDIGGDAFTLHVAIESPDYDEQEAGQAMLKSLIGAVNLAGAEDSSELHNLPFELQVESGGALTFNTITAADAAGVTA